MPRSPKRPDQQPEFFVDRSLGRHLLPDALRKAGFVAHTLASVYGEARAQTIQDEDWLRDAGERGLVVLTKDGAIRRRPAELAVVKRHAVRMFCLPAGQLPGPEQTARFISNAHRMVQRSRKPGPWVCGVYEGQVRQLWP